MSTLKPLRKPEVRPVRRGSAAKAAAAKRPPTRLIAAAVLVGVLAVVGILIARSLTSTVPPSNISVEQAVRTLKAPTGQTSEGFWYMGNADAPVTVMVFGDFQCPSCQAAYQSLEKTLDATYIETGKVKFVYHDLPLQMHPNAVPAAKAARAAGAQGKFWAMHDLLYARQLEWSDDQDIAKRLKSYAAELGLDQQAFNQAFDSSETASFLTSAVSDGNKQGISATPTYMVDGKVVTTSKLTSEIDAALQAKGR